MKKTVCIICGKEKNGLQVKDDYVLETLRWIKTNITKNVKNYNLVVCKEDFLTYQKKRDGFERKEIIYGAIGVIFLIALIITSQGNIGAVFVGLAVTIGLLALAHVSYIPAVELPAGVSVPQKKSGMRERLESFIPPSQK